VFGKKTKLREKRDLVKDGLKKVDFLEEIGKHHTETGPVGQFVIGFLGFLLGLVFLAFALAGCF
jgi:hypothetical protein